MDDLGRRVTKHGYLLDHDGSIIDQKGNKVFDKKLIIDGNVPIVFTPIKGANKEKREQVKIIPRSTKGIDPHTNELRSSIKRAISKLSNEHQEMFREMSSQDLTTREPLFGSQ